MIAPLTLATAVFALGAHPVAPLLALGIGVFTLYTYSQVIIGQEYLRLPGNVERFFPLLLAIFILAEAVVAVLAWRIVPPLPRPTIKVERAAGVVLLLVAAFLVFGQHLRPMLTAWTNPRKLDRVRVQPDALLDGQTDGPRHHCTSRDRNRCRAAPRPSLGEEDDVCGVHRLFLPSDLSRRHGNRDEPALRSRCVAGCYRRICDLRARLGDANRCALSTTLPGISRA